MRPSGESCTNITLLNRLHRNPADPAAWSEFVRHYGQRIYRWCRSWNLQDADAADVTQNVLMEIARQMRTFRYDPSRSFRGWLRTLTRAAWVNFVQRQARQRRMGQGCLDALLAAAQAPDELAQRLEEQYEAEVLEEASLRVRLRIEPRSWETFRLLVYEGLSGEETAARLGMTVGAVYMAKSRILKLLQTEIKNLDGASTPE